MKASSVQVGILPSLEKLSLCSPDPCCWNCGIAKYVDTQEEHNADGAISIRLTGELYIC